MQCGTGVTMSRDGIVAEWLRWVVLIASGSLDRPSGMHFHRGLIRPLRRRDPAHAPQPAPSPREPARSCRACWGRSRPSRSPTRSRRETSVRSFVTGGNPLTAFPQPARLRAALETLDVLAVVDVAESPLTALATHVLPATGQLERADVTLAELTALESRPAGDAARRRRPSPTARPVWWMFAALNAAMGRADARRRQSRPDRRAIPAGRAPPLAARRRRGVRSRAARRRHADRARLGPRRAARGWSLAHRAGAAARTSAALRRSGYRRRSCSRRVARWRGATRSRTARRRTGPSFACIPMPRQRAPSRSRPTTATSRPTSRPTRPCARGVVSISHGHLDENPGDLTSGDVDVDPLTAMPRVAGLDVRVTATSGEPPPAAPPTP